MANQTKSEDSAAKVCRDVVAALQRAGVQPERLAQYVPRGRRLLFLPRPATMLPLANVWRLGRLLLDEDAGLWAAGQATRSAERGRVGYQSTSREERLDIAAAAHQGGYPVGTPVNYDAQRIDFEKLSDAGLNADSPLGFAQGEFRVRWRAGAPLEGAPTLQQYLSERAELLVNPPLGAT